MAIRPTLTLGTVQFDLNSPQPQGFNGYVGVTMFFTNEPGSSAGQANLSVAIHNINNAREAAEQTLQQIIEMADALKVEAERQLQQTQRP